MTVHPITVRPATRKQLEATPETNVRAACLLLFDHGIDPYEIPAEDGPDAERFTPDGYLVITGYEADTYDYVYARRPWPDGITADDVHAALEGTR